MKKKMMVLGMAAALMVSMNCYAFNNEDVAKVTEDLSIYRNISEDFDSELFHNDEVVLETYEVTIDMLCSRCGKNTIIEKCIGLCKDSKGNGELINSNLYNYISYKDVRDYSSNKKVKKGDVVLTYLFYNPENNYCDDIMERIDFIIDRNTFD